MKMTVTPQEVKGGQKLGRFIMGRVWEAFVAFVDWEHVLFSIFRAPPPATYVVTIAQRVVVLVCVFMTSMSVNTRTG